MKKILSLITCFAIIFLFSFEEKITFAKEVIDKNYIESVIDGIVKWKKQENGSASDECLMTDKFLEKSGTTVVDWYAFGLGRMGIKDNQGGYRAVVSDYVNQKYKSEEKLHSSKTTEWHRITLSILASGGNPRAVGEDKNNDNRGDIDLIADGTYNRVDKDGKGIIENQGLNGFIFALIALDSMMYSVPLNSAYNRDDIIVKILKSQLPDGGWTYHGNKSDADMTAMAVQALSPYVNSEREYVLSEIHDNSTGNITKSTKKVRTAVKNALKWLSEHQDEDGGFSSYNVKNCESCIQVIVALSSVGIDVFSDENYIKNGKTIYQKMLEYKTSDGGFTHSYITNDVHSSLVPGGKYAMADGQALYGNVALLRFLRGERRLYDLRKEQSEDLKSQINVVSSQIDSLDESSSYDEVKAVYQNYLAIPSTERSYVFNYFKLSKLLEIKNIPYEEEKIEYNDGDAGVEEIAVEFTKEDREIADNLPSKLTLQYKNDILLLNVKIKRCNNFAEKEIYKTKIENAFKEILKIEKEIEAISTLIKENLYPTESVNLSKRDIVYQILSRFNNLSDYDKNYVEKEDRECLLKSKKIVDSSYSAMIISIISVVVVVILVVFVVIRIVKRKNRKKGKLMEESEE